MPRVHAAIFALALSATLLVAACDPGTPEQPDTPDTSLADDGCPSIFAQGQLAEYRVTIAPAQWNALNDEFLHRAEREAEGLNPKPYHPARVELNGETIPESMIRLKGESSWWHAIMFDEHPKMQFVIAFNQVNKDGRFAGVRKVDLDMPRSDASFLRQRLALYYFRAAGITAQCANSARLYVNDEYYGLYTHLESVDKEFLQRHYGNYDEGDLWKGARFIRTNEESFSWDRLDLFWTATRPDQIAAISDLDRSVEVWAHEATPPHGDGYYNGRANFYLYDHPTNGFTWIPYDLDSAFDYLSPTHSPMYPRCEARWPDDRYHWSLVLSDPDWLAAYRDGLARARAAFDPDHLEQLVDVWARQIEDAARDDRLKPFSTDAHYFAVDSLYAYPRLRAATLDTWLDCWANGGNDADGDGFEFCNDCDDESAQRNPGAQEICNGVDDNCDGSVDELEECQ